MTAADTRPAPAPGDGAPAPADLGGERDETPAAKIARGLQDVLADRYEIVRVALAPSGGSGIPGAEAVTFGAVLEAALLRYGEALDEMGEGPRDDDGAPDAMELSAAADEAERALRRAIRAEIDAAAGPSLPLSEPRKAALDKSTSETPFRGLKSGASGALPDMQSTGTTPSEEGGHAPG